MNIDNSTRRNEADRISGDRREDRRYPIALELRYKLIRRRRVLETGTGRTIDLSSGGILFETDHPLPAGLNVELSIEWPALLHDVAPMRLVVTGRIVRTDRMRAALRTVQHEFRTQGIVRQTADAPALFGNGRTVLAASPAYMFHASVLPMFGKPQ